MRILLIEDERRVSEAIAKNLRAETFAVDVAFLHKSERYPAVLGGFCFDKTVWRNFW